MKTNNLAVKSHQNAPIQLSVIKPDIQNAIDIYRHYNIPVPSSAASMDETKAAVDDIAYKYPVLKNYCAKFWEYLCVKQYTLQVFVLQDKYRDMLNYTGISGGHWAENYYRNILIMLCTKYRLLSLTLELCPVPDMQLYCDKYDISAMDKGCPEAFLGVLPFSLMWGFSKKSILLNYSVPLEIVTYIKRFL